MASQEETNHMGDAHIVKARTEDAQSIIATIENIDLRDLLGTLTKYTKTIDMDMC